MVSKGKKPSKTLQGRNSGLGDDTQLFAETVYAEITQPTLDLLVSYGSLWARNQLPICSKIRFLDYYISYIAHGAFFSSKVESLSLFFKY